MLERSLNAKVGFKVVYLLVTLFFCTAVFCELTCESRYARLVNALERCHRRSRMSSKYWSLIYDDLVFRDFQILVMDMFVGINFESRLRKKAMYAKEFSNKYSVCTFVEFNTLLTREEVQGYFNYRDRDILESYTSEELYKQRLTKVATTLLTEYVIERSNV